jgi:hypothetical protein
MVASRRHHRDSPQLVPPVPMSISPTHDTDSNHPRVPSGASHHINQHDDESAGGHTPSPLTSHQPRASSLSSLHAIPSARTSNAIPIPSNVGTSSLSKLSSSSFNRVASSITAGVPSWSSPNVIPTGPFLPKLPMRPTDSSRQASPFRLSSLSSIQMLHSPRSALRNMAFQ